MKTQNKLNCCTKVFMKIRGQLHDNSCKKTVTSVSSVLKKLFSPETQRLLYNSSLSLPVSLISLLSVRWKSATCLQNSRGTADLHRSHIRLTALDGQTKKQHPLKNWKRQTLFIANKSYYIYLCHIKKTTRRFNIICIMQRLKLINIFYF